MNPDLPRPPPSTPNPSPHTPPRLLLDPAPFVELSDVPGRRGMVTGEEAAEGEEEVMGDMRG